MKRLTPNQLFALQGFIADARLAPLKHTVKTINSLVGLGLIETYWPYPYTRIAYRVKIDGYAWVAEYKQGTIQPYVRLTEAQRNALFALQKRGGRMLAFIVDKRVRRAMYKKGLATYEGGALVITDLGEQIAKKAMARQSRTNASHEVMHND